MLLEMAPKHVSYPLSPYPVIREFATMVSELKPGNSMARLPVFRTYLRSKSQAVQFLFRDRRTGITTDFSETEWDSLRKLFREALGMAQIHPLLDSLALQYGEV